MAKPKLALIPAAQGSKLFSVLPSSGVGDFDFTRSGSTTRINSQGLIETVDDGVSRLNYPMIDGKVVGCPSHILEPQSINVASYSENFNNGIWTKNLSSITLNDAISPDGSQNASKLESTNDGLNSRIEFFPSVSDNTVYTSSMFVKKGDLNFFTINIRSKSGVTSVAYYDIENGIVTSTINSPTDASIKYYGNDWYRVSISVNVGSGVTSVRAQYVLASADGNVDTDNGSFVHIFGAQFEPLSYPTSYIPTNGSPETRQPETATDSGDAATFNDSEGVLMAEISSLNEDTIIEAISISDGTGNNRVVFMKWNVLNQIKARVTSGSSQQFDVNISVPSVTDNNKLALKYKANDFSAWVNGFKLAIDTSGIAPVGLNRLEFNSNGSDSAKFIGNTKQVQYYNSVLTDIELEQLTSWTSFTDMAQGQLYTIE